MKNCAYILLMLASVLYGPEALARLTTEWGDALDKKNVWNVYPRPTMERERWMNLNGEWDYAVTDMESNRPKKFQGKILVPFAIESQLSGVERSVGPDSLLWYTRKFRIPTSWKGDDVLLNFGAVDWKADVWVNGVEIGSHKGGFAPFSFNITKALRKGENEITVKVWDPTGRDGQPHGKQTLNPGGIMYTAVTGIWQTVWLEPVAPAHISRLKITPDVDANVLRVEVFESPDAGIEEFEVVVSDGGSAVADATVKPGTVAEVRMPDNVKLWSTNSPFLYDLEVKARKNGKTVDKVESYAAMRKIGMTRRKGRFADDYNASDNKRFTLNNKVIYHYGPLDQGWWPDGLLTAPSYEALVYDVDKTADLGFNMIRKHMKTEPEVWYEYCDRKGILVWQDMPGGGNWGRWQNHNYFRGEEPKAPEEADAEYRREWAEIMESLYNHPCVAVWIPFNEGWGQHDTKEIADETKQRDPSRLVDAASGGSFFFDAGDILDIHNYPAPMIYLVSFDKANVVGEFGGIGLALEGHLWWPDRNWGYVKFKTPEEVTDAYLDYLGMLSEMSVPVYTGAVYTQTTDVEGEVNGLITYDRKKVKVDEAKVRAANLKLINDFSE